MKRFMTVISGIGLVLTTGCGTPTNNTTKDMATTTQQDLVMAPIADMAVTQGRGTGEACSLDTDCAGNGRKCTKTTINNRTGETITWTDGYCTSNCSTSRNDSTSGLNTRDCPGGGGTCGADSKCYTLCDTSNDCRDANYGCFVVNMEAPTGCRPRAESECNPRMADSCNTPGGLDAGLGRRTCVNTGDGTVGACSPSCDPFASDGIGGCLGSTSNDTTCHASDVTGEGLCTSANTSGAGAGSACGNFYSDCPGGYGCLNGKCWKYCNDSNVANQCKPTGDAGIGVCMKFRPTSMVPTSKAGICAASM